MILACMVDLGPFLVIFFTQLIFFASAFSVLGFNEGGEDSSEYRELGLLFGQFLATLRHCIGDFDYNNVLSLDGHESRLFWMVWTMVFYLGCLIMLNFIIAEVSSSYENVKSRIDELVYKQRATMIKEVEDFIPERIRKDNKEKFPRFFVVKEYDKNS